MPRQTSPNTGALIRNAGSAADWQAVREICCQTGNAGAPIATERWPFFSEYWIGPYQKLAPRWTYVAELEGRIIGYLTGCPDTLPFVRRRRLAFVIPLAWEVFLGQFRKTGDVGRFMRRSFLGEKGPEENFPCSVRKRLMREFPAHLHVNVLETHRSSGVGQRLLSQFLEDLEDGGISGVHLFCGNAPVAFYERSGFSKFHSIEFRPKGASQAVQVHALVRSLSAPRAQELQGT
jgi:hypothetical protein